MAGRYGGTESRSMNLCTTVCGVGVYRPGDQSVRRPHSLAVANRIPIHTPPILFIIFFL